MRFVFIFLILVSILCGCRKNDVKPIKEKVWVKFHIDWNNLNIRPASSTVLIYNIKDGRKESQLYTNYIIDSLLLPVGDYSIIVFNNVLDGFASLFFSNIDDFNKISVHASELNVPEIFKTKTNSIKTPDILAVDAKSKITVSRCIDRIYLQPKNKTKIIRLSLKVAGLQNLGNPISIASIEGLAEGLYLHNGYKTCKSGTQYLNLKQLTKGSDEGILYAESLSFGLSTNLVNKSVNLKIFFKLKDGSFYLVEKEVQNIINETDKEILINIESLITIPPNGNVDDSVFQIDIKGWKDNIIIDTPIN